MLANYSVLFISKPNMLRTAIILLHYKLCGKEAGKACVSQVEKKPAFAAGFECTGVVLHDSPIPVKQ
jgi:hypothetical protein